MSEPFNRRLFLFPLAAVLMALVLSLPHCGRRDDVPPVVATGEPGRFMTTFPVMGTDATLVVYAGSAGRAVRRIRPAVHAIRRVEQLMSLYRPDSEISALNNLPAGTSLSVSAETYEVIAAAVDVAARTSGAFDITFTPLRDVWRRAQQTGQLPTARELEEARTGVGFEQIRLLDGRRVALTGSDVRLDLGGIAKGYAVDAAIRELVAAGCRSALVNIGGDMRVLGRRRDGRLWRIQIRDPRGGEAEPLVLEVEDLAVVTSGDYARYFQVGEERFSHIIDPRTGWPVRNVPSVTVTAPDAMMADALATALSVLGPADGLQLVEAMEGVECLVMHRTKPGGDGGEVTVQASSGFQALLAP